MTREIDDYFLRKEEPVRSYLLALREYILRREYHSGMEIQNAILLLQRENALLLMGS